MNNSRRKRIVAIKKQLRSLQTELENIKNEEQYSFDHIPFSFLTSDKAGKMSDSIESLTSACTTFESIIEYLDNTLE